MIFHPKIIMDIIKWDGIQSQNGTYDFNFSGFPNFNRCFFEKIKFIFLMVSLKYSVGNCWHKQVLLLLKPLCSFHLFISSPRMSFSTGLTIYFVKVLFMWEL